ncbi:MAG: T9SS type A sorting domain-containing protein [Candidatus Cloacimonadales bacterium]|nr:T9SS type A sorting domain-containing protein [Candidatus Cloacimonadales bacterium]
MKRAIAFFVLFLTMSFLYSQAFPPPQNLQAEVVNFNEVQLTWEPPDLTSASTGNNSRSLYGYTVYRDDCQIVQIEDPFILSVHDFLDSGEYEYFVTALYSNPDGESSPSNIVQVVITFPSPQNLTATSLYTDILLEWEVPNYTRELTGFLVYRDNNAIVETLETIYLDEYLPSGTYTYYIIAVYGEYFSEPSNFVTIEHTTADESLISTTELLGNYPNPFNPSTIISFSIEQNEHCEIVIYNLKGQKVKTFSNLPITNSTNHQITWNGDDENNQSVGSGIYFYQMNVNGKTQAVKKCLLLK